MNRIIDLEKMVDVTGGVMNKREIEQEFQHILLTKNPEHLIVDMKRDQLGGYRVYFYVDTKTFCGKY